MGSQRKETWTLVPEQETQGAQKANARCPEAGMSSIPSEAASLTPAGLAKVARFLCFGVCVCILQVSASPPSSTLVGRTIYLFLGEVSSPSHCPTGPYMGT